VGYGPAEAAVPPKISVNAPSSNPVILYDGVCALCNGAVRWMLREDRRGDFRFAALQSDFARRELSARGMDAGALNTMYLVADGKLFARSQAAIEIGWRLGGKWKFAAVVAWLVPWFIRDWMYDWVARNRYQKFGKYEACPVPPAEWQERFLG
jgi:predicted DCC family thiol-disulfide oxidoreductase YuxK